MPFDRPNIVLISIDSLRYDPLDCYGHPKPTFPLDEADGSEENARELRDAGR